MLSLIGVLVVRAGYVPGMGRGRSLSLCKTLPLSSYRALFSRSRSPGDTWTCRDPTKYGRNPPGLAACRGNWGGTRLVKTWEMLRVLKLAYCIGVIILLAAGSTVEVAQQPQEPAFRSAVERVAVAAIVRDSREGW